MLSHILCIVSVLIIHVNSHGLMQGLLDFYFFNWTKTNNKIDWNYDLISDPNQRGSFSPSEKCNNCNGLIPGTCGGYPGAMPVSRVYRTGQVMTIYSNVRKILFVKQHFTHTIKHIFYLNFKAYSKPSRHNCYQSLSKPELSNSSM